VPPAGLEPARPRGQRILSLLQQRWNIDKSMGDSLKMDDFQIILA
jgi:hypothetical protein